METAQQPCSEHWASPEWRAEALGWITAVAHERGIAITGECRQPRIRFWSTQLTVPTDAGPLWFKENCPGQAFEARLVSLLAELIPDHVVAPLAIEDSRGWFLSADGGATLADGSLTDVDVWVRVVQEWADVQRRLAGSAESLRSAGVSALPPQGAPDLLADRIEAYASLPASEPAHLDTGTAARLRALLPTVERWARQLVDSGLPLTLEHNDLHANNAFAPRPGERRLRFFDFGDAVLGHPLCSLMIPIRVLSEALKTEAHDPRVRRIVDAYLETWTDLVDRQTLRAAVEPAMRLALLHRAESWRRVLPSANSQELQEWGSAPVQTLIRLLDDAGASG